LLDLMADNSVPALAQQGARTGAVMQQDWATKRGVMDRIRPSAICFFDSFDPGYNMALMLIVG
jgi:hypothetical protein